jgi:hypothetical protein
MNFLLVDENGQKVVEGVPDDASMTSVRDIDRVIEACYSEGASAALLYATNLTPGFFDLSSGEAGEILQKLRNYHIRLAVVCAPGSVVFTKRFSELMLDERRGTDFGVFETRAAALEWLRES